MENAYNGGQKGGSKMKIIKTERKESANGVDIQISISLSLTEVRALHEGLYSTISMEEVEKEILHWIRAASSAYQK
jgi:hypothetical protein